MLKPERLQGLRFPNSEEERTDTGTSSNKKNPFFPHSVLSCCPGVSVQQGVNFSMDTACEGFMP